MSTLIIVLRIVPLLAFAGPVLFSVTRHRGKEKRRPRGTDRAPLVANFAAIGLYLPSLLALSGSSAGSAALLLAACGALLGVAGAFVVVRSRAELGPAWSLVPRVDHATGLVTTGPYRLVRHPIYSGFLLFAMGEALAFGSWPAVMIVVCGIAPTFAWRARSEEKLLCRTFGDRYALYQKTTKMVIPYLL